MTVPSSVRRLAERAIPPESPARPYAQIAAAVVREGRQWRARVGGHAERILAADAGSPPDVDQFLARSRATEGELARQRNAAESSANDVSIHAVVLPATGSEPGTLHDTLDSLSAQSWPNWRATVHAATVATADLRAVFVGRAPEGDPLSHLVDEEWLVVLRAGETVEPDLFFELADLVWERPGLRLVSWDDEVPGAGPERLRLRPEWSPEMLLSRPYLDRSFSVPMSLVRSGGWLELGDPASWWSFTGRIDLAAAQVARIPRVLAHLGAPAEVGADAAAGIVGEIVDRRGLPAEVRGSTLVWDAARLPSVSVIVPTRHHRELLGPLFESLRATSHPRWEIIVIDNGGETSERNEWYEQVLDFVDHTVIWWTEEPFNYSRVNNVAARSATGDVLVFLNDDTVIVSPEWLDELSGWAAQPGIATVGVQLLDGDGLIQHGGVVVGMNGFADHLFGAMRPHGTSLLGPTDGYRNVSANTAACVACERSFFDAVGGFDERFVLCGSDVVLGLDGGLRGLRNLITTSVSVRHLESATRGRTVPPADMYASYWRYNRLLTVGDPYFHPALSLLHREPALRPAGEPTPLQLVGPNLGRGFGVFRQSMSEDEAYMLAGMCRVPEDVLDRRLAERDLMPPLEVRTVNWFIPDFDNPFYGGLATIFRIADHLQRRHGVENRFIVWAAPNEQWIRSGLAAIFPGLADSEIVFWSGSCGAELDELPGADVAIATQWPTAYAVAAVPGVQRRAYLVQDFEPMFYPAGTQYALAEETYKLGLLGVCNTTSMLDFYRDRYQGRGVSFVPAVDRSVFHHHGRVDSSPGEPLSIFLYARPGHWRNCWELVSLALDEIKRRHGRDVRIVTAGSWARPEDLGRGIDHLGLLDYRATGDLYRTCDIGVSLTVSPHPSYLPLELMACGVPVVAFDLPPGYWVLKDGENCLLARRTVDSLVDRLDRLVTDPSLRNRLAHGAVEHIAAHHDDWDTALSGIYAALCDPSAAGA